MKKLESFYEDLLDLGASWKVTKMSKVIDEDEIEIHLKHQGRARCPHCNEVGRIYDYGPQRRWRHLDIMQCKTYLVAKVPRVECSKAECIQNKVSNVTLPWAGSRERFSYDFQSHAIDVILASKSISSAQKLLKTNWHQTQQIKEIAVERGLKRRKEQELPWIGMDEKSFLSGHRYASIMYDLGNHRVIDVEEGRSAEVGEKLIDKSLSQSQQEQVCGVCIDMSAPYEKAIKNKLYNASIVHDKFHIAKHLNEAVDKTRRAEHKALMKEGNDMLKGMKYKFLCSQDSLSEETKAAFEVFNKMELKVSKAHHLKELFGRHFWSKDSPESAQNFFMYWAEQVVESKNQHMAKVASMMMKRLKNILSYFECFITNGVAEGINSKIQSIKANARGFRAFESYRISILFHCGKLKLHP